MNRYKLTGTCFLAGVHSSRQRIERHEEAASAVDAVKRAFAGFHRDIWVRETRPGEFTAMFGSRACGSVRVEPLQ